MRKASQLTSLLRGLAETLILKFYGVLGPRLFSRRYFEYRYRRRTDPWNYETSPYERRKYEQTLAILNQTHYARVLEVGCSIGVFTEQLAAQGIADEIVGIDVAENALDRARERLKRFPHVKLRLLDVTRDPLEGSFDLIICAEVLYYLGARNIRSALKKLLNVLTEEGRIVFVNPWPLSQQLHGRFFVSVELRLVEEHVERDAERPYAIALYAKS